jgi:hypothetical protein
LGLSRGIVDRGRGAGCAAGGPGGCGFAGAGTMDQRRQGVRVGGAESHGNNVRHGRAL